MFLTPIYIAMTFLKTWRVRSFHDRLLQFLGGNSSVAFYKVPEDIGETPTLSSKLCIDTENAHLCELVDYSNIVRVCSMKPNQIVNLSTWIPCSKNLPFASAESTLVMDVADISIIIECDMEQDIDSHDYNVFPVEKIGNLIAWQADKHLALLLKTNIDKLSIIGSNFASGDFIVNYKLPVVRIQTVLIEGAPLSIKTTALKELKIQLVNNSKKSTSWRHWPAQASLLKQYSNALMEEIRNIESETKDMPLNVPYLNSSKSLEKIDCKPVMNVEPTPKLVNLNSNGISPNEKPAEVITKEIAIHLKKTSLKLDLKPQEMKKPVVNLTSEKSHGSKKKFSSTPRKLISQKATEVPAAALGKTNSTPKKAGASSQLNGSAANGVRNASRPLVNFKSPNILIYSDSKDTRDNIENMLKDIIDCNRYTVYPVNSDNIEFVNTSALAVIAGDVSPRAASLLSSHFLAGGKMFAICSDLLHTVLPYYKTAEVRENEIVQFSYEQWHAVRMKHHIFCYQASPAKKQFSTESDKQSSKYNGHQGHELEVEVLASEETWRTPSLLQATDSKNKGIAVFSQIHLDTNPLDYLPEDGEQSNEARLGILKRVLGGTFGLHLADGKTSSDTVEYTKGYFLGNHVHKLSLIERLCKESKTEEGNPFLSTGATKIEFYCSKGAIAAPACPNLLPVMVHGCPEHFSTLDYFDKLSTVDIGRLVLYSDVLTSSQHIIKDVRYQHGFLIVPRMQTAGTGRSGNVWLSPDGCAMLSLQLICSIGSPAGTASRMQHLAALAVVHSIRSQEGYQNIDLRIKWPNDVYFRRDVKIGGAVANASCNGNEVIVNIGVGVNLDNSTPTTCINDVIDLHNRDTGTNLSRISFELYLARFCNTFEQIYLGMLKDENLKNFYQLYYKYWLHSDERVKVQREGTSEPVSVKIVGIDNHGFLRVVTDAGKSFSVQPDGNSFDMMTGLIAPKSW